MQGSVSNQPEPAGAWQTLIDRREIRLYLDYDGTLVSHTERPLDARPDDELLAILSNLCSLWGVEVAIVSGRPRSELQNWLGGLPATLWAEHGATWREPGGDWSGGASISSWSLPLEQLLNRLLKAVPGSSIELKEHGLAWHYRAAPVGPDTARLSAFSEALSDIAAGDGLEVMPGDGVIEVRRQGIHKGLAVNSGGEGNPAIVAIGNDRTDEDMFRALPASATSIVVGTMPSSAMYRVAGVSDVRRLLNQLILHRSVSRRFDLGTASKPEQLLDDSSGRE